MQNPARTELLALIARVAHRPEELDALFNDLLTPKEYHDLVERYVICRELAAGATVAAVCAKTGVASATVVRGNRVLKYGTGTLARLVRSAK